MKNHEAGMNHIKAKSPSTEEMELNLNGVQAIHKALQLIEEVFTRNPNQLDSETLHRTKSVLYGAMESLGTTIERLSYSHRLMRELFSVLNLRLDSRKCEQDVGLQILHELRQRLQNPRV